VSTRPRWIDPIPHQPIANRPYPVPMPIHIQVPDQATKRPAKAWQPSSSEMAWA